MVVVVVVVVVFVVAVVVGSRLVFVEGKVVEP